MPTTKHALSKDRHPSRELRDIQAAARMLDNEPRISWFDGPGLYSIRIANGHCCVCRREKICGSLGVQQSPLCGACLTNYLYHFEVGTNGLPITSDPSRWGSLPRMSRLGFTVRMFLKSQSLNKRMICPLCGQWASCFSGPFDTATRMCAACYGAAVARAENVCAPSHNKTTGQTRPETDEDIPF